MEVGHWLEDISYINIDNNSYIDKIIAYGNSSFYISSESMVREFLPEYNQTLSFKEIIREIEPIIYHDDYKKANNTDILLFDKDNTLLFKTRSDDEGQIKEKIKFVPNNITKYYDEYNLIIGEDLWYNRGRVGPCGLFGKTRHKRL